MPLDLSEDMMEDALEVDAGILPTVDDPELRAALEELLQDPDPEVRREAEELIAFWLDD